VALLRDEGPVLIGESDGAASAAFAADLAPDWPELQGVMGAAPDATRSCGNGRS
jgi:hypothetical protein